MRKHWTTNAKLVRLWAQIIKQVNFSLKMQYKSIVSYYIILYCIIYKDVLNEVIFFSVVSNTMVILDLPLIILVYLILYFNHL